MAFRFRDGPRPGGIRLGERPLGPGADPLTACNHPSRRWAIHFRPIRAAAVAAVGISFSFPADKLISMGVATAKIRLENAKRGDLQPVQAEAMADTGAPFLCIPDAVRIQLQLGPTSSKKVVAADGAGKLCPYFGPIRVLFENRECHVGAVVLGDEALLGAFPMEDMDLAVIPSARRVVPNPLQPNFAAGPARTGSMPHLPNPLAADPGSLCFK